MLVAYWTHKTTNTHSKCVIFTASSTAAVVTRTPLCVTCLCTLPDLLHMIEVLCLLIFCYLLPLSFVRDPHFRAPFSPSFCHCHRPCSYPLKIIGKISHYRSSWGSYPTVFKFQLRYCKDYMPPGPSCVCPILDEKCRSLSLFPIFWFLCMIWEPNSACYVISIRNCKLLRN